MRHIGPCSKTPYSKAITTQECFVYLLWTLKTYYFKVARFFGKVETRSKHHFVRSTICFRSISCVQSTMCVHLCPMFLNISGFPCFCIYFFLQCILFRRFLQFYVQFRSSFDIFVIFGLGRGFYLTLPNFETGISPKRLELRCSNFVW